MHRTFLTDDVYCNRIFQQVLKCSFALRWIAQRQATVLDCADEEPLGDRRDRFHGAHISRGAGRSRHEVRVLIARP
jgi:hypothetical protein